MTRRAQSLFLVYAAAFLAFTFTGLLGTMIINTFAPLNPPIMPAGMEVEVGYSSNGFATLYETRHYKGSTTDSIQIQRHISQYGSMSKGYVIEGGFIGAESNSEALKIDGTFSVKRAITLPVAAQGIWCSGADIIWYPVLSLKAHRLETEDICFEVKT